MIARIALFAIWRPKLDGHVLDAERVGVDATSSGPAAAAPPRRVVSDSVRIWKLL